MCVSIWHKIISQPQLTTREVKSQARALSAQVLCPPSSNMDTYSLRRNSMIFPNSENPPLTADRRPPHIISALSLLKQHMKLYTALIAALVGATAAQDTASTAAASTAAAVSATESSGSSGGSSESSSSPSVHLHGSGTTNPSKCKLDLL